MSSSKNFKCRTATRNERKILGGSMRRCSFRRCLNDLEYMTSYDCLTSRKTGRITNRRLGVCEKHAKEFCEKHNIDWNSVQ